MTAGQRNTLLEIHTRSGAANRGTWVDSGGRLWARARGRAGDEALTMGQIRGEANIVIEALWIEAKDIAASSRLIDSAEGRTYHIKTVVDPDGKREIALIAAEERRA